VAETAIRFLEDRSRSDVDDDEMLRHALTKLVEIVGKAAKQVTPETRAGDGATSSIQGGASELSDSRSSG
jgi:uncharacterized protein with HEPN domain